MSLSGIHINSVIRGHVDQFYLAADGHGRLVGWVFREDTPIDKIDITLGDTPWISGIKLQPRPDVRAVFEPTMGSCPHLTDCGFAVAAPLPDGIGAIPEILIRITPFSRAGLQLDDLFTYYCAYHEELSRVAQPPAALQDRIGGSKDFLQVGVQATSLVITCIAKFEPAFRSCMILDWGCGCARVIGQLTKFVPSENLYGCDIDSAAIEWNMQNIAGPTFARVNPYPPTPYAPRSFDIVYGISVMTHLDEETQILWLDELKRITRPGAILALSVIGEKLRATNMPASLAQQFAEKGFASFVPVYSDLLSEFSHQEYYKEAYHTIDYIAANWSRYFEVLEYVETKHQDVVILRSP